MGSDLIRVKAVLRNIVLPVFLLIGLQSPVLAEQMWKELFEEYADDAKAGDIDAQYEVGVMYLKGQGVEQDRKQAIHWLQTAAKAGNQKAASKLNRVKKQQEKFDRLVKKAESGDATAQHEVAMMYLKGKGVKKDGAQARKWLSKAAAKNDSKAITRLGIIYYKGEGGPSDYSRALKLLNRVGDSSVLAQYYLGEMYANGAGVKQDYMAAIDWYKKAADGGFSRSRGKIINIEEEIRVQKLRQKKAKRAQKKKTEQPAKRVVNKQPSKSAVTVVAKKPIVRKAVVAKAPPRVSARKKPAVVQVKKTPLEKLANRQWLRGKKPLEYLPSKLTQCDKENGDLVCLSKTLTREQGTQTIRYRVKSFIKLEDKTFMIVYRNLVLDVEDAESAEDQASGFDGEVEQGFKVRTGWTQEHSVSCKQPSGKQMDCIKDRTYKMKLVSVEVD